VLGFPPFLDHFEWKGRQSVSVVFKIEIIIYGILGIALITEFERQ
jgi:hypothetical protein